jgi:hypothetical protein
MRVGYLYCISWLLRLFLFEKLGENGVVEPADFGTNQQKKLRRLRDAKNAELRSNCP